MDNGQTEIAIGDRNGQVIWTFPNPVTWVALDPENARQIAEATAKAAYKCRYGVAPETGKSAITEAIRMRMITRVSHVIRSLQEKQKLPGYIAMEVVDTVLSEVA